MPADIVHDIRHSIKHRRQDSDPTNAIVREVELARASSEDSAGVHGEEFAGTAPIAKDWSEIAYAADYAALVPESQPKDSPGDAVSAPRTPPTGSPP
jgi:hypothetical protein